MFQSQIALKWSSIKLFINRNDVDVLVSLSDGFSQLPMDLVAVEHYVGGVLRTTALAFHR
ncbi:hypothetical protein EBB59_01730 [Lysobacter pythonis]|uniref:Uncharacterized protein n=1 Tax=Solilutibacter pythonis TaxID=2483112 RepID=A0A3M2I821_9GAMM|nr:hypothetical protein EBB59_01730 [Lysobacter pythonis]